MTAMQAHEPQGEIAGTASVILPPGMTQEEADRLVREADQSEG